MGARLSCFLVILAGATCSGCLLMGALPPTRADIGPAVLTDGSKTLTSVRFTAGVHAASVVKKRIPYDIGAGYTLTVPESRIHWRPEKAARGTATNYIQLRLEFLTDLPLITFEATTCNLFGGPVTRRTTRRPRRPAAAVLWNPWWSFS